MRRSLIGELTKSPKSTAKAVGELREAGLTMDPKLVYAEVAARDKELDSAVSNPNLVASKADFAAVNEALARMIASADKQQFSISSVLSQRTRSSR